MEIPDQNRRRVCWITLMLMTDENIAEIEISSTKNMN